MNLHSFFIALFIYNLPSLHGRYGSNTKQSIDQLQPGIRTILKTVTAHIQNKKWSTKTISSFMSVLLVESTYTGLERFNLFQIDRKS